jgi:hypothetical protein
LIKPLGSIQCVDDFRYGSKSEQNPSDNASLTLQESRPNKVARASDFYKRERSACNLGNLQLRASQYGYACLIRRWVWIVDGFFKARLDSRAGRCCFDERKGFDA